MKLQCVLVYLILAPQKPSAQKRGRVLCWCVYYLRLAAAAVRHEWPISKGLKTGLVAENEAHSVDTQCTDRGVKSCREPAGRINLPARRPVRRC